MRFLVVLFLLTVTIVSAQEPVVDTTQKTHSVKKAALFSAVIPGAGQIYNHLAMPKGHRKAFWKVPLIYAGLGASGYFMLKNNQLKNELRHEYESRIKGNAPSSQFSQYDDQGLLTLYGTHRQRRDLLLMGFGIVYILNVVDAGVEAHFTSFDISDDLTLSIHPAVLPGYKLGMGFQLNFR